MLEHNRKKIDNYQVHRTRWFFGSLIFCILAYVIAILWILGSFDGLRSKPVRHCRTFPCVNVSYTSCKPVCKTGEQLTTVKFRSQDAGGFFAFS